MRFGSQLLFGAVISVTVISVGLVLLTQLRKQTSSTVPEIVESPKPTPDVEPKPLTQRLPVRLLFGGDLMFDRNIRLRMQEFGVSHPLAQLTTIFAQYDAVIANLEGPVTNSPSRSVGSVPGSTNNFFFTFQPEIVPMLRQNSLTILNLGNNHITNFGTAGVTDTKKYLGDGGITFFGNTGQEKTSEERIALRSFGEHIIGFVNLNQFTGGGFETAIADTQFAASRADIVIVMPHWGEEYTAEPNEVIRQQAHALVDAGADAVIGAHPHVTQPWEEYQGKRIYYSLGNFVFDQYFSPEVQRGLLVGMDIFPDQSVEFTEVPIQLEKNGQTVLPQ